MRIGLFQITDSMYGGSRYEAMAMKSLALHHSVHIFDAKPWLHVAPRPQILLRSAWVERHTDVDLWIRVDLGVVAMSARSSETRNIAVVHHVDESIGRFRWFNRRLYQRWLEKVRNCDRVIVVSMFWRDYFAARGVERIHLIYNAFDVDQFKVTANEIEVFKEANDLTGKPIVYIGNCQRLKGAGEVYDALKNYDYHFVTSGVTDIELPVRRFNLCYTDYIRLLASSDVVLTMSRFLEGWNRTAHEALLCRTPVIGSGKGGMGELLRGSGQCICTDSAQLSILVPSVIEDKVALGERGYAFASTFTYERFAQQWVDLVAALDK